MRDISPKALVAVAVLFIASLAGADTTISFVPTTGGSLSSSSVLFGASPQIRATAFYYDTGTSAWIQGTSLFGRNEGTDELGIGVCSPGEPCPIPSAFTSGGGETNELSNQLHDEIIVLSLPVGYTWVSVGVSSLDTNSGTATERGMLFSSNNATPTGAPGSLSSATNFCNFAAANTVTVSGACSIIQDGTTVHPVFSLTNASDQSSKYIYFEAYDWQDATNKKTNNDYLVEAATVRAVPEPGALVLLGTGLLLMGNIIRRKFSA